MTIFLSAKQILLNQNCGWFLDTHIHNQCYYSTHFWAIVCSSCMSHKSYICTHSQVCVRRFVDAKFPRRYRNGMPKATIKQLLRSQDWLHWAETLPDVTELQLAMARGPVPYCQVYHRMQYQGVTFCTEPKEESITKFAVDSLVLTWYTDTSNVRHPYVGRAQRFLKHIPPWATGNAEEREAEAVLLVDAHWFKVIGHNDNVYKAPVVTRAWYSEVEGNLYRCDLLEPISVGVGPYYGVPYVGYPSSSLWQVLVKEVATFKELQ